MQVVSRRVVAVLLEASVILAACNTEPPGTNLDGAASTSPSPSGFFGTALDPALPAPAQPLLDTRGQPVSVAERARSTVTVLFFGYTHCPDVCPTTMADLAAARRRLPAPLQTKVTVLFVTEDPTRDTPAVLRGWLDRYDPTFVGLIGGNTTTTRMLSELYLPETTRDQRSTAPAPGQHGAGADDHDVYGISHSGVVYAFTSQPPRSIIYTGGTTPAQYTADFTRLAEAIS